MGERLIDHGAPPQWGRARTTRPEEGGRHDLGQELGSQKAHRGEGQAEQALQKFEGAMSSGGEEMAPFANLPDGQVREMPRPADMSGAPREMPRPAAMDAAAGSSSGVPDGWGNRQSTMSEAELVRKGIIPPPDPLSTS